MKKISIFLFVTMCMMLMSSGAFADISSNLVLDMPLNNNVQDYSDSCNVATNYGATFVDDRNGAGTSALSFDGNDYVEVQNDSSLNMGIGDFSISFWVKPNPADSNYQIIFDKRQSSPGWSGYYVYLYGNHIWCQLAGLRYVNGNYGYYYTKYDSGIVVTAGIWQLVTITVDRDSATGLKFYVNTTLEASLDPTNYELSIDSSTPGRIGSVSPFVQIYMRSVIDGLKIYKRVLSATDITELYVATNPDRNHYMASEGINDLSIDTGTDPEVAMLARDSGGVFVDIVDVGTGNVIKTITNFFSGSLDFIPVAITSVNVTGGQAIVVSARNEVTDQMASQTYDLVADDFVIPVVTLDLYGN